MSFRDDLLALFEVRPFGDDMPVEGIDVYGTGQPERLVDAIVKLVEKQQRPIVGDAPAALHAALNLTWGAVRSTPGGGAHTDDEADEIVMQQLQKLTPDEQSRASFVLSITRSLLMAVRTR